jgi:hypothetical protein
MYVILKTRYLFVDKIDKQVDLRINYFEDILAKPG